MWPAPAHVPVPPGTLHGLASRDLLPRSRPGGQRGKAISPHIVPSLLTISCATVSCGTRQGGKCRAVKAVMPSGSRLWR